MNRPKGRGGRVAKRINADLRREAQRYAEGILSRPEDVRERIRAERDAANGHQAEPADAITGREAVIADAALIVPTTDIAPSVNIGAFEMTETGLVVHGQPSRDEWAAFGKTLKFFERAIQFAFGDWAAYGEDEYPDAAQEFGDDVYQAASLSTYASIARSVNRLIRIKDLTFQHHREVASVRKPSGAPDTERQYRYLCLARDKGLSAAQLKQRIKDDERAARFAEPPALPEQVYSVVYLDPPWEYRNSGLNGAAEQHYPSLSTDALCTLPGTINLRCAENSVLFMWATSPLLPDALRIIEAWDFAYKASMVWLKDRPTYGKLRFYVSTRHELLLIATRGSFQPAVMPDSIIEAARKDHSEKPDIYPLIESMYPRQRYLELFARRVESTRLNWTYWGNEVHAHS